MLWIAFSLVLAAALAFDLGIAGRREGTIGVRFALWLSAAYIVLALAFGGGVYAFMGPQVALEYFSGYALEKALSLDNIFVFVVILDQLKVPAEARHKVLFWGVVGALVLRAVMVFGGAALLNAGEWVIFVFGGIVILGGLRMLFRSRKARPIERNRLLRLLRKILPMTRDYDGRAFVVRRGSRRCATPLLVALILVESTDVVFAFDSIPAIFGITRDTFVVFTSNAFAVLGLRALFFAVAGLVERLHYLHYGLAFLLVLIGIKMLVGEIVAIPAGTTLAGTLTVVGVTVAASLLRDRRATT